MFSEVISYIYYCHAFRNQITFLYLKCIPMFVTVLSFSNDHEHRVSDVHTTRHTVKGTSEEHRLANGCKIASTAAVCCISKCDRRHGDLRFSQRCGYRRCDFIFMGSQSMKTPGAPTCVTARASIMVQPDNTAVQDNAFRQFL